MGGRSRESFVDEPISAIHPRRKSPLRFFVIRILIPHFLESFSLEHVPNDFLLT
jgi:hypothetical protein